MGQNREGILISPSITFENGELIKLLDSPYTELNRSTKSCGKFYWKYKGLIIGRAKTFTIVLNGKTWENFGATNVSKIEKKIATVLNSHRILAFGENSTAMVYFYNLIENGQRIRGKAGGGDGIGIEYDYGEELPEEKELYDSKAEIDGETRFVKTVEWLDKKTKETKSYIAKYTHEQIGGSMGSSIAKNITGRNIDQLLQDEEIQFFEYLRTDEYQHELPKWNFIRESKHRYTVFQNRHLRTKDFVNKLNEEVISDLVNHNFTFDEDKIEFSRDINGITQFIKLSSIQEMGDLYFKFPKTIVQLKSDHLQKWYQQEFNTIHWNQSQPSQTVSDIISVSIEQSIHDDSRRIILNQSDTKLNYREIVIILKSYILDTIIPYLDFHSSHEILAKKSPPNILQIEYLLSINKNQEAKKAICIFLKALKYPNTDEKYSWMIKQLKSRIEQFDLADNLEQLLNLYLEGNLETNKYEINKTPINDEYLKLNEIPQEEDSHIIERPTIRDNPTIQTSKKKPWWKIWQ